MTANLRAAFPLLLLLAASCASPQPPAPGGEQSADRWPDHHLALFIFDHLDASSFRNSTGPPRKPGARSLGDHGVARPDSVADDRVISGHRCSQAGESEGCWLYDIRVLARRDFNGDGEDEVGVCFVDEARNGGSYRSSQPLVLKLVAGRVLAIDFDMEGEPGFEGCARYPQSG